MLTREVEAQSGMPFRVRRDPCCLRPPTGELFEALQPAVKADEDIHLPLQGLDYWARVQWHHGRGEFLKFGYFGGRELSAEAIRLGRLRCSRRLRF